jgi:hypothetical protein
MESRSSKPQVDLGQSPATRKATRPRVSLPQITAALAALIAALSAGDARASDPYYKGKRLSVLINFAPDYSADIEGWLFAKHLVKHLEGQP